MEETARIHKTITTVVAGDNEVAKRYIARLAWLLGTGQAVSATVPSDEIKEAESYLLRIGIAAPITARTPNVSPIPSRGRPAGKRALSAQRRRAATQARGPHANMRLDQSALR